MTGKQGGSMDDEDYAHIEQGDRIPSLSFMHGSTVLLVAAFCWLVT